MSDHTLSSERAPARTDPATPARRAPSGSSAAGAGRWLGALGIASTLLFALGFVVLAGKDFGVSSKPERLVDYYHAHYARCLAAAFAVALGTVAFAFFAGVLRNALLAAGPRARHLCAIATVGTALYLGGLLLMTVFQFSLADAGHHRQALVAQTLNYLDQDDFFPTVAGLAVFMLATGTAIVRTRALPVWLGWIAVALGVLALAGPAGAIAFLAAPLWTLVASIVLLRRRTPVWDLTAVAVPSPAA